MTRRKLAAIAACVLVLTGVAGTVVVNTNLVSGTDTITAHFKSATAIYPGDEVRVSGVKIGTISKIEPEGTEAKITMKISDSVPIPAEAKAIIVSQSLIAARYVQLAPAYRDDGPTLPDGAVIPLGRTAIPVEWDEVKTQLSRLATELGPHSNVSDTSVGRLINSAADALEGNGDKLRRTLAELSGVGRILAEGSGNIADIITNLARFVDTLRDSKTQIVQFQDHLATLSSVVNDTRSNLDAALTGLSDAVGDVQRFIAKSRDQTAEQVRSLAAVTQNVVDHKRDLEQVLHVAPNAQANYYNMYNPTTGTNVGSFVMNNFSNPVQFICASIGALENTTAPETAKRCAEYLGPALHSANFNFLPMPVNPFLAASARPEDIIYADPKLAPGGSGPSPAPGETPPAVSAYTGLPGDDPTAPPPPGPPPPAPHMPQDLAGMLLPAETPAP